MSSHHQFGPSRLGLRQLCPGSYRMEMEAEKAGRLLPDDSEASAEGTLLHSLVRPDAPLPKDLTLEQREALETCREYVAERTEDAIMRLYECPVEVKVATDGGPPKFLCTGTSDLVALYPYGVRVIDFKFGRLPLAHAIIEPQGRGYAVGAMQKFRRETAEVSFFQPREKVEVVGIYHEPQVLASTINGIIEEAQKVDAPRIPGYLQCQHCRGKLNCPDFHREGPNLALELATVPPRELDAAQLDRLVPMAKVLGPLAGQILDEAKRRLLDGTWESADWRVKEVAKREVTDVPVAWEALRKAKVPEKDLARCAKLSVGALDEAVADAFQLSRKAGGVKLAEVLGESLGKRIEHHLVRKEE